MIFDNWKAFAFAMLFFALGLYAGYSINVQKTAEAQAHGMCATCQENVQIMVDNFNVVAKQCSVANPYRDMGKPIFNTSLQ